MMMLHRRAASCKHGFEQWAKQCTGIALDSSASTRFAKPRRWPIMFAAPSPDSEKVAASSESRWNPPGYRVDRPPSECIWWAALCFGRLLFNMPELRRTLRHECCSIHSWLRSYSSGECTHSRSQVTCFAVAKFSNRCHLRILGLEVGENCSHILNVPWSPILDARGDEWCWVISETCLV